MKTSVFPAVISTALCVGFAQSLATGSNVIHEQRDNVSSDWVKIGRPDANAVLDLRIGLAQANMDVGEELMKQISHPHSGKYGQFLSPEEVVELFAPPAEAFSKTVRWLLDNGIDGKAIKPSAGRNWIKAKTSVKKAEELLDATYYVYQHDEDGLELVACESYSVPQDIQSSIDLITPTIQFESRGVPVNRRIKRRDNLPSSSRILEKKPDPESLETCSQVTTPACLRALYGIPEGESVDGNSYGIVEFAPQSYNQVDLNGFFSTYSSNVPNDTAPVLAKIDGGYLTNETGVGTRGESNLDLCYAMALVHPQEVTLYQVGDNSPSEPATNNNFLDAIDGSYCEYKGGDDPDWDAKYPHDGTLPDQWTNPPECGTQKPAHVISVSYGSNEADRPASYRARECSEYMKLGLMGVSVMFASGDTGVAGFRGVCREEDGTPTPVAGTYGRFNPIFPASCPWVTAVGGSALPPNGSVTDKEVVASKFAPGGGFSDKFALPSYQADAVAKYYANHAPAYNSSQYNNTQQARGYPDVTLMAQDYITGLDGEFVAFTGTSASTPTFGAMITLINGERIKQGRGPVGFVNPVLYSHPEIFNDVTEGHTSGCGTDGFKAVEGWDAASGLGTPNFDKLKKVFMDLP